MSDETIMYRPMRREDYPALTEMVCRAWFDDGTDHDIAYKAAKADFEYSLACTTTALVAQCGDEVVGAVLGGIDSQETRSRINRHHRSSAGLLFPLMFSAAGRAKMAKLKESFTQNKRLMDEAKAEGHAYDAQIVLFIVRPDMRGKGIGKHLFDWMLGQFHDAGVTNYYLFTDNTCDYGFYEKRGLNKREIALEDDPKTVRDRQEVAEEDQMKDEHLHAFMFDNEVSPANGGVNPLGRD